MYSLNCHCFPTDLRSSYYLPIISLKQGWPDFSTLGVGVLEEGKMADFSENPRGWYFEARWRPKIATGNAVFSLIKGSRRLVFGLLSLLRPNQSIINVKSPKLPKMANKVAKFSVKSAILGQNSLRGAGPLAPILGGVFWKIFEARGVFSKYPS